MRTCIMAGAGAIFGMMGAASAAPALSWSTDSSGVILPERMLRDSLSISAPHSGGIALKGLYEFDRGTWRIAPYVALGLEKIDFGARTQTTPDWIPGYQFTSGVSIGFTQKLIGSLGYRWTYGEKGHFALGNVPAKIDIGANRLVLGLDYRLF